MVSVSKISFSWNDRFITYSLKYLTFTHIKEQSANIILLSGHSGMADSGRRKFRLNCKNLFLTYPQNDTAPGDAMSAILERFGLENVSYVCVSQEQHQDGNKHLHALVCLKEKCDIKNAADLDIVGGGKHGNYSNARSVRDVHKYVKKHGNFVEHGEPPLKTANEKKTERIAQCLRDGGTLEQVEEMDPGYFLLHQPRIREYSNFVANKRAKTTSRPAPYCLNLWGCNIEIGFPREFKQKQYWIYGPPNTGKTSSTVLELEAQGFKGFQIPIHDDFSMWEDDCYDFAYIDEFKGCKTIQFWNEWLQGTKMTLNAKYGMRVKTQNIPTIILSNYAPQGVYQNVQMDSMNALLSRLHIICSQ